MPLNIRTAEETAPIEFHPNIAEVYRRKVGSLQQVLNDEETRPQAVATIRSLIDRIEVRPGVSRGHCDADTPVWIIPGDTNKRGKIIEGRTKNGREQKVLLSRQAAALFRKAISISSSSEYVFPADLSKVKIGKGPRTPHIHGESVTMAMRRLRSEAGIEDISIHDMRRAASNWLKDQGVSREVRDLILNHKDPSVTEAHYSTAARMEKQVRAALQSWADHVGSLLHGVEKKDNVLPFTKQLA